MIKHYTAKVWNAKVKYPPFRAIQWNGTKECRKIIEKTTGMSTNSFGLEGKQLWLGSRVITYNDFLVFNLNGGHTVWPAKEFLKEYKEVT